MQEIIAHLFFNFLKAMFGYRKVLEKKIKGKNVGKVIQIFYNLDTQGAVERDFYLFFLKSLIFIMY